MNGTNCFTMKLTSFLCFPGNLNQNLPELSIYIFTSNQPLQHPHTFFSDPCAPAFKITDFASFFLFQWAASFSFSPADRKYINSYFFSLSILSRLVHITTHYRAMQQAVIYTRMKSGVFPSRSPPIFEATTLSWTGSTTYRVRQKYSRYAYYCKK